MVWLLCFAWCVTDRIVLSSHGWWWWLCPPPFARDAMALYEGEERWRAVNDKDRRAIFEEFMTDLERREKVSVSCLGRLWFGMLGEVSGRRGR